MSEKDRIIMEVDSSMSMEGMPLTEDDKARISLCLDSPERFGDILAELVALHTVVV